MHPLASMLAALSFIITTAAVAATPQQEQAFVDTYRKAFEGKDAKTLASLLYTKGADPQALEFYRMMMTEGMGGKIGSIRLQPLSADDKAKVSTPRPGPGGRVLELGLVPTRKLVMKTETKSASGSSTSTRSVFVAEHEGRLVIPVPVAAK